MVLPATKPVSGLACVLAIAHRDKVVDVAKLAVEIELAFGVRLAARLPSDVVHGHISTLNKRPGAPFLVRRGRVVVAGEELDVRIEVDDCPMCGAAIPRADAHDCLEVVLYAASEPPNAQHASSLQVAVLTAAQLATLATVVDAHLP